jgi:putative hydrolase of the HAD superfamily
MRARPRGLLIDWGGVLTQLPDATVQVWARAEGIDYDHYQRLIDSWLEPLTETEPQSPVHAVERGEIEVSDFERRLASSIRRHDQQPVSDDGLLDRMFKYFAVAPEMIALVAQIKQLGVRTGLLSNSWGNSYPREGWDELFDVVVISGEVGMRKPEPEIFRYATDLLGVPPAECVFVDDLTANVTAAKSLGLTVVLHRSYDETRDQLQHVFGATFA